MGADDEFGVLDRLGFLDFDLEGLLVFGGGLVGVPAVEGEGAGGFEGFRSWEADYGSLVDVDGDGGGGDFELW